MNTFPRADYKHLCEYVIKYLDPQALPNFKIHKPGAAHEARFMADSLYILSMAMTQPITNYLDEANEKYIKEAAIYVSAMHAMNFLKSSKITQAASNDLTVMKKIIQLRDFDKKVADAFFQSYARHSYYLTEENIVFSLFNEDLDLQERANIARKLGSFERKNILERKAFKVAEVNVSSTLDDFVGANSWLLFNVFNYSADWLQRNVDEWSLSEEYRLMKQKVEKILCVNDCCERAIKLVQDFVHSTLKEEKLQDSLLVYKDNRRAFDFESSRWSKKC